MEIPKETARVLDFAKSLEIDLELLQVDSEYYNWELEQRMQVLNAPSIHHLCKTVVFENTRFTRDSLALDSTNKREKSDSSNSIDTEKSDSTSAIGTEKSDNSEYYRFVMVCVQYTDKINSQKLNNWVKQFSTKSRKHFNMRVASPELALELTGYSPGGINPFGNFKFPIVLTKNITLLDPPVMYLGAGHVDWKLCVDVNQFINKASAQVVDLE